MKYPKIIYSILIFISIITSSYINEKCETIDNFNFDEENKDYYNGDLTDFFEKKITKEKENGKKSHSESRSINAILKNNLITIKEINISKKNPEEEIKILTLLKNKPGFIQLQKCVQDEKNQKLYIFLEKKEKDLSSKKNENEFKKSLTKKQRIQFYKNLLQNLNTLHKLNHIQGKIAPWNIMTDSNFKNEAFTDFENSTEIGKISKGGPQETKSPEKFVNENCEAKREIDIYALGMSILILENGRDQVREFFYESFKFSEQFAYWSVRNRALDGLRKNFYVRIMEVGVLEKFKNWFFSFFMDNRFERIYDFSDLVENMCAYNQDERLEIPKLIEILDKIIFAYSLKEEKDIISKNSKLI